MENGMTIKNALASVAVKDLASAVKWYERLLSRPADSRPMPEVAEWRFERGGWLQVYQSEPQRAGNCSVTLAVDSIDEQLATLKRSGVETGSPAVNAKVKTLMLRDPDGNHIAFAQTSDPSMAR
jgi:predicted enzyme related to lactoylglutathione lyase